MEPNPVTCEAYSHVRNRGCYHPAKNTDLAPCVSIGSVVPLMSRSA